VKSNTQQVLKLSLYYIGTIWNYQVETKQQQWKTTVQASRTCNTRSQENNAVGVLLVLAYDDKATTIDSIDRFGKQTPNIQPDKAIIAVPNSVINYPK
jgi:hypothetical protein